MCCSLYLPLIPRAKPTSPHCSTLFLWKDQTYYLKTLQTWCTRRKLGKETRCHTSKQTSPFNKIYTWVELFLWVGWLTNLVQIEWTAIESCFLMTNGPNERYFSSSAQQRVVFFSGSLMLQWQQTHRKETLISLFVLCSIAFDLNLRYRSCTFLFNAAINQMNLSSIHHWASHSPCRTKEQK